MPIVTAVTDVQNLGIAEIDRFYGVLYIIHGETFIAKRCTDTIRDPLLQKISSEKLSIRITMSSSFSAIFLQHRNPGPQGQGFYAELNAVLTIRPVSVTKIPVVGCRSMIAV